MKTILISGGSGGLGKDLALSLSKSYQVVIISRNEEKKNDFLKINNCDYYACDIIDYQKLESVINKVYTKYKHIDVLINNAGKYIKGNLETCSYEGIKKVIDTNVLGTINITKLVIPYLKKEHESMIISINSEAGINATAQRSIYAASKHALRGLMESLEKELVNDNVKCVSIYPSALEYKMSINGVKEKRAEGGIKHSKICSIVSDVIAGKNKETSIIIKD